MTRAVRTIAIMMATAGFAATALADTRVSYFPVTPGSRPHDVAVAADGKVWYSGQRKGYLGLVDPATGKDENISIGSGSAPHGVIVAPDGAAWLTDGGLNANVRYDPVTKKFDYYMLPPALPNANLNTGVFDKDGIYWFTGQNGVHGYVNHKTGKHESWKSPRRGTYGITVTPTNEVWYVALAGDHLGKIDKATGNVMIVEPHKKGAGPRRVWTDSKGLLWVSFWHSGEVGVYDPAAKTWKTWLLAQQPRQRLLLGLCRRAGQGLAHRLHDQRDRALRSQDRKVRELRQRQEGRAGPPDARPGRRGLGRGIRQRPSGADPVLTVATPWPARSGQGC